MLLLKASPCSLCAYALLIHEINIKHIRALRFFFLSNASLSLLLTMYWSCQTYFIFSSVVAQYLYPQYFYPFCILLHSVLYICSQFPGFYKHKHVTFFYNLVRFFFCFFFKSSFCLFPCSFLPLSQPTSPLPPSLSLSFILWLWGTGRYYRTLASLPSVAFWRESSATRCLFLFVCFMQHCTSHWPVVSMSCKRESGSSNQKRAEINTDLSIPEERLWQKAISWL